MLTARRATDTPVADSTMCALTSCISVLPEPTAAISGQEKQGNRAQQDAARTGADATRSNREEDGMNTTYIATDATLRRDQPTVDAWNEQLRREIAERQARTN